MKSVHLSFLWECVSWRNNILRANLQAPLPPRVSSCTFLSLSSLYSLSHACLFRLAQRVTSLVCLVCVCFVLKSHRVLTDKLRVKERKERDNIDSSYLEGSQRSRFIEDTQSVECVFHRQLSIRKHKETVEWCGRKQRGRERENEKRDESRLSKEVVTSTWDVRVNLSFIISNQHVPTHIFKFNWFAGEECSLGTGGDGERERMKRERKRTKNSTLDEFTWTDAIDAHTKYWVIKFCSFSLSASSSLVDLFCYPFHFSSKWLKSY